jgi:imidazolonepropionase-like amidohydrolase
MKKTISLLLLLSFSSLLGFSQTEFSEETQKYIAYRDAVIVFKNALLIDGKGNPAKTNQTIMISNGKITWIGDDTDASPPKEAKIIDMNGRTLMPGLVMLHEHMYISGHSFAPRMAHLKQTPVTFPRLYLGAGATTIRTAGSIEPYSDLNLKSGHRRGKDSRSFDGGYRSLS